MAKSEKDIHESEKSLLSRWSERKLKSDTTNAPAGRPPDEQASEKPPPPEGDALTEDNENNAVNPEDLPDIDSLDEDSDFTVFLKEGVPEEIRNLALRKLWRSNPLFANLDGLNDYDEDYSKIGMVVQEILTGVNEAKNQMAGQKSSANEDPATTDDDQETPDKPEKTAGADEPSEAGGEESFEDDGDLEA